VRPGDRQLAGQFGAAQADLLGIDRLQWSGSGGAPGLAGAVDRPPLRLVLLCIGVIPPVTLR